METIMNEFDFLKKTVIIQFTTKLIEKILDPNNNKEYYQSHLKNKTKNW